ncbi:MAG: cytochrome c family protein [Saprospiraceae bacterium]|nr:cytochrome c family protein [Saprospiraceae bacterium]
MRRGFITYKILIIAIISNIPLVGQLSPGPLAEPHSHLEGMSNCTQCHDIGNKVPNTKCLECHDEINSLLKLNRGLHAHSSVKGNACASCHNDHHGKRFEMIRFDEDNFDHTTAGYDLEGAHSSLDCRACHQSDNISNQELKKRENTYLGLDQACLSCHNDFHQGTLQNDCTACHGMEAWRPADYFNHDDAAYALKGAHQDVSCVECHAIQIKDGQEYQEFVGLVFNDCVACHADPHSDRLPGTCTQCHTEAGFDNTSRLKYFNHNLTKFELKGAHNKLSCYECHSRVADPLQVFQDKMGISQGNCIACHDDVHDGKFGTSCTDCHTEESFFSLKDMSLFNHSLTNFPLEGLHSDLDCASCHKERYSDPIPHNDCKDCHQDYHEGVFIKADPSSDCNNCHNVQEHFSFTSYGFEEHQNAAFTLDGAHMATPCFACHMQEDKWVFREIGQNCNDCHSDIHEGYIDAQYYPDDDCTSCHSTETWGTVDFDHTLTEWSLNGQHALTDCRSCHFDERENGDYIQEFEGLNTNCSSCHDNIHGSQFELDGITDCTRCHHSNNWRPDLFNHDNTKFKLEGKHVEVACSECHTNTILINDNIRTDFNIEKFECIDCHLQ